MIEDVKKSASELRQRFLDGKMTTDRRVWLLKALLGEICKREDEILAALRADFNKNEFDSYATEVGVVKTEIRHALRHVRKWSKTRRVRTGLVSFPSRGYIMPEGYGAVLVISPWNYPFQLCLAPLVGAISAGNTVMLKPSAKTANTARIIDAIVTAVFDEDEVCVTLSREATQQRFDYIFFTGGAQTGKMIMQTAAQNLTPISLELGGKSPAFVDESADVALSAKRLAWGKFVNAGQTCVAPDYILVHRSIYDDFTREFAAQIDKMFYINGELSPDFAYLVDEQKGQEMQALLRGADIVCGGKIDGRIMQPTVVRATHDSPFMKDEIFAPLAPLIPFDSLSAELERLSRAEKPLAFYYFGKNGKQVLQSAHFGGGCINESIMHVAEANLPFGGVGQSGMGRYHGKASFDTFTHYKSVLSRGKIDFDCRFMPHTPKDLKFIKRIVK